MVLFVVFLLSLAVLAAAEVERFSSQREREADLLFVGNAYSKALSEYAKHSPKTAATPFPDTLADLLQDPRVQVTTRYLRQLYPDPITASSDWGLVRDAKGGIRGIYSLSKEKPIRVAGLPIGLSGSAKTYREWKFYADAPAGRADGAPSSNGNAGLTAATADATDTGSTGAAAALPPAPTPSKPGQGQDRCASIAVSDAYICNQFLMRGQTTLGNECTATAQQRAVQCSLGEPMVNLRIR